MELAADAGARHLGDRIEPRNRLARNAEQMRHESSHAGVRDVACEASELGRDPGDLVHDYHRRPRALAIDGPPPCIVLERELREIGQAVDLLAHVPACKRIRAID